MALIDYGTASGLGSGYLTYVDSGTTEDFSYWTTTVSQLKRERRQAEYMRQMAEAMSMPSMYLRPSGNSDVKDGEKILKQIKKSVKKIKAESVGENEQAKVKERIEKLEKLGVKIQAEILKAELEVRIKLMRLSEWNYEILTKEAIGKFERDNKMTATKDGIRIHIDPLEKYCGNPQSGEAKDRLIPDNVLGKLEEAQGRQVFDEFAVLWAERVPDPILLGCINGCEDYFYIAEWGKDISFDELMGKKK